MMALWSLASGLSHPLLNIRERRRSVEKVVVSVLGKDRPGIVAAVTKILSDNNCNIEDVSQTILQNEFAGIFITSMPERLNPEDLLAGLQAGLKSLGVHVVLKQLEPAGSPVGQYQPGRPLRRSSYSDADHPRRERRLSSL